MSEAPEAAVEKTRPAVENASNQPITDAVYGKKGRAQKPKAPVNDAVGRRTFLSGDQLIQKLGAREFGALLDNLYRRTK